MANKVGNNKPASGNKVGNNQPAKNPPKNGVGNNKPVTKPQPTGSGNNRANEYTETVIPGVENKPVAPFLTQQDIEEYAEAREQYEMGLKELDENYESQKHNNEGEEVEIEKGRIGGKARENWDAAGRGLFNSSIRDADLADIDATAEIKKKFLSDQLTSLALYNEGQKTAMGNKWHRYEEALHRKEVQNAEEVDATMPKWQVEPSVQKTPIKNNVATPTPKQNKPFKVNEPIGFNPGHQTSKNGGITAPPPNPSVSPGKKANPNHVAVANNAIAGRLYG